MAINTSFEFGYSHLFTGEHAVTWKALMEKLIKESTRAGLKKTLTNEEVDLIKYVNEEIEKAETRVSLQVNVTKDKQQLTVQNYYSDNIKVTDDD